ncbi:hypothetical protein ACHQM5_002676 [Ranunculus cassubicifolius]
MATPLHYFIFLLLTCLTTATSQSNQQQQQSYISALISQKGLDFAKDILIDKAISSLTPLQIPKIHKSVKLPFLGNVQVALSNTTINQISVSSSSSYIKLGDTGIAIVVSGATANLTMDWYYSYNTWFLLPVRISDRGSASIQVEGMEVGLTLGLEDQQGTLKLSLMECGCYVNTMTITLDGGASWFYQGLVNAFEEQIIAAVESSISKKIREGILKLDSLLQTLPKEIPVDDIASLNATFVNDPSLGNSSIGIEIDGLFAKRNELPKEFPALNYDQEKSKPLATCKGSSKMIGISLNEAVFSSASVVYFNAGVLKWVVDKVPEQSLLNTAGWKYVIPQLYRKYPNDDMKLNISFSSPAVISVSSEKIDVTAYADMTIDVVDANQIIPVACISVVISASGSVEISGNMLVGSVGLDDFTLSLKWSNVGNFHMSLIRSVVWSFLKTVATPYINSQLRKGFPLPIVRGFTLDNADVALQNSVVTICSDVVFKDNYYH